MTTVYAASQKDRDTARLYYEAIKRCVESVKIVTESHSKNFSIPITLIFKFIEDIKKIISTESKDLKKLFFNQTSIYASSRYEDMCDVINKYLFINEYAEAYGGATLSDKTFLEFINE